MAYQVIARKWRPQAFADVTGQEPITRTLRGAIEHERLHHAYLFSGARGVGKTTTARLLAKALNCHRAERPTPTPCAMTDPAACASCREIAEGRSIDVLEIDAASNTQVDNVRDVIISNIGISPARDRFKVFIIDEVHMLSNHSFNALLKTLEEPPPHVVFVMATTESHKLPNTILSRCQQFEFRTIAATKIFERLRLIADAEKIDVADDALREIARAGEGSMRDAQSAFDQVISFSGARITVEDVETALGIASAEQRARVMRAIADESPADALAVVDDLVMRGHDLRNFCRDLLAHLRDLLVVKVAGDAARDDAERSALKRAAEAFSESDLVRFFHSLTETESSLRESVHPRYQLEIGLVKLIEMRRLAPLGLILERLAALEQALRGGNAGASSSSSPPPSHHHLCRRQRVAAAACRRVARAAAEAEQAHRRRARLRRPTPMRRRPPQVRTLRRNQRRRKAQTCPATGTRRPPAPRPRRTAKTHRRRTRARQRPRAPTKHHALTRPRRATALRLRRVRALRRQPRQGCRACPISPRFRKCRPSVRRRSTTPRKLRRQPNPPRRLRQPNRSPHRRLHPPSPKPPRRTRRRHHQRHHHQRRPPRQRRRTISSSSHSRRWKATPTGHRSRSKTVRIHRLCTSRQANRKTAPGRRFRRRRQLRRTRHRMHTTRRQTPRRLRSLRRARRWRAL